MIDNITNDTQAIDTSSFDRIPISAIDKSIARHTSKLARIEFKQSKVSNRLRDLLNQVNREIEPVLETIRIADMMFTATVSVIAYARKESAIAPWHLKRDTTKPPLHVGAPLPMPSNKVVNPKFNV
jgi:hypothetical protein